MSISSAMNAGVSGLAANSSRLGTISDNIANSQTVGVAPAACVGAEDSARIASSAGAGPV